MSASERPWWATEEGATPDPDDDPLAAHREARRGRQERRDDESPADDGSWWVPATEAVTRLARDLAASATSRPPDGDADDGDAGSPRDTPHRIDACGVCPICVGLRALGESRPELVGHLAEAARQLALAVRTVVDAAAPTDHPADAQGGSDGLQRIDLDD